MPHMFMTISKKRTDGAFILIGTALLISFSPFKALANENAPQDNLCGRLKEVGAFIMEERQHGAAMTELMNALPHNSMYRELLEDAYEVELKGTEEEIQRAITDFSKHVHSFCQKEILEQ